MFKNSVGLIGLLVAVGGWLWLLFGIGAGAEMFGRDIVNIHSISIAQSVINAGYMLIVAGVVLEVGEQVLVRSGARGKASAKQNRVTSEADDAAPVQVDDAELLRRKMMEMGIRT